MLSYQVLISLFMYAGHEEEAKAAVAEIQREAPGYSLEKAYERVPYKEGPRRDQFLYLMHRASELK